LSYLTEVEYNAKQDEKQQHEAKMKQVDKIEQLHEDKETPGKLSKTKSYKFISLFKKNQIKKTKKIMIHLVHE
jgi:hypothetical protein